ncbi:hypothetical protein ACFLRC_04120 [Candidatus Altiarchaeota archaeon]
MKSHGQASTEYLVILAVVIVVALVVVAVLGGFIDIGRSSSDAAAKTYWRGADIGVLDWVIVGGTGDDTMVFRNNLDYTIEITDVSVGGNAEDITDITLKPGESSASTEDFYDSGTQNSTYTLEVIVTYTNVDHSITGKTFTGVRNIVGAYG